ncbi:DUF3618 domain-containing protein [Rugosimonospora africana]|uniref:DUF3618 domain-containing protein n=1 Tax=Rugosimonospora africana TaxID=556532 RepID=A0A8J3QV38_9ACTN|nr:DUF3618 domain-containing protein [Rugosimonospora africana]GIH16328.1 hypothetical protein Raf01_45000 [Rugosimonospora africana]
MNHSAPTEDGAGTRVEPEALRRRIAYTRDELADTVEALTAKADVKTRAAQAAVGAAGTVTGELHAAERAVATGYRSLAGRTAPWVVGLLLAGVSALFAAIAARRRRR